MKIHLMTRRMWASVCILFAAVSPIQTASAEEGGADTVTSADSTQRTRQLNELVVTGASGRERDRIGHLSMSGEEINRLPALLGEHDVIKALQSSSGVVAGTEGFAGLYVRGGENDQNLYILDGLPLFNVYHFGGLFSTFNTHSIQDIDFYKGAFPSIYGEGGSAILDVSLKRPDYTRTYGTFSVGLISGQLWLSTPLKRNRSALSVALRRTWFDVFSIPALAILNASKREEGRKTIFHYNFTDLALRFSWQAADNADFSALLFYGKDNFKLGEERFDPNKDDAVTQRDINKMGWGNRGLALTYRLSTSVGELRLQPYLSQAFAMDEQTNMDDFGNGGSLTASTVTKPSVLRIGMKETFTFPIIHGLDGIGGLQQVWSDFNTGNPVVKYSGNMNSTVRSPYPGHVKDAVLSGFAELRWNIAGAVQGTAGIRAGRYLGKDRRHWNLEPRLSVKLNLPRASSLSLGFSRVAQYAQQVSSAYMYLPSDAWLPTASCMSPLICDTYSLGYFRKIKEALNVKGELWLKDMHGIAAYRPNTSVAATNLPWHEKLTFGKGLAYGLDLEAEGVYGPLSWGVAYGLMWNWRKFADLNEGRRFPAKFDNRHKIDITLGWTINRRLELTGQWEYMTGNRTTVSLYNIATPDIPFPDAPSVNPIDPLGQLIHGIDFPSGRNNVRMPAFHRLNLNLSLKGRINDRLTYQWDFGLYNAYCHMNPFTIIKSYSNLGGSHDGDYRRFRTLSLLPTLPSVSFTLNF